MQIDRALAPFSILLLAIIASGCNRNQPANNNTSSAFAGKPLIIQSSDSPAGTDSREPDLSTTSDGRIILSWVEKIGDKGHALRFSIRNDAGWSPAGRVAEGESWFVNWADFPSVVALTDGSLAAHWLVKSGLGTYAYDINIARSSDGGKTWSKPIIPHTDKTQTEHGFVSLVPLNGGRVGAIWLDGRHLKDVKGEGHEDAPLPVNMTLRYAAIDAEGRLSDETELDGRVCECCQTSAALTNEGIIAVYRDRSDTEIRDIHYVAARHASWTAPRAIHRDNWQINGCPVNGPAVAADNRRVVVAWYTEANQSPRVRAAFSSDGGVTFGNVINVDDGEAQGPWILCCCPTGPRWFAGSRAPQRMDQ